MPSAYDNSNAGSRSIGRVAPTSSRCSRRSRLLDGCDMITGAQDKCPSHEPRAPPSCKASPPSSTSNSYISKIRSAIGLIVYKKAESAMGGIVLIASNPEHRAVRLQVHRCLLCQNKADGCSRHRFPCTPGCCEISGLLRRVNGGNEARQASGSNGALWAYWSLGPLRSLWPDGALWSSGASRAFRPCRTHFSLWTSQACLSR